MNKYRIYYYDDEAGETKTVTVTAMGILSAIDKAKLKHIELKGCEIVGFEKI